MGGEESLPSPSPVIRRGNSCDSRTPLRSTRLTGRSGSLGDFSLPCAAADLGYNLVKLGFNGIWSIVVSPSLGPCPRTNHFSCYDESTHTHYIGYGVSAKSRPLADLWALNTVTYEWQQIPLIDPHPARSGARAALKGNLLYVFGGYANPTYFADLHTIDITTGQVSTLNTIGDPPTARSTPIVAIHSNRLYVWGGFNGEFPAELHVLDLEKLIWSHFGQEVGGRTAAPFVIFGDVLFSYGGSKNETMLTLNLETFEVTTQMTMGSIPPGKLLGAGMIKVGKYALFVGGKDSSRGMLVYACDLTKLWWFVFHVMVDGETTSLDDGIVSDHGMFLMPRIHSFAGCYIRERRQVLAMLGAPERDPPPLFVLSVGEALPILNLRDDLVEALQIGGTGW
jgi:hypothetical protein